jgi:hypothetical protein
MGKDHIKRVNQLKEKRNSRNNDSDEEAALTKYAKLPVLRIRDVYPGSDFFPSGSAKNLGIQNGF